MVLLRYALGSAIRHVDQYIHVVILIVCFLLALARDHRGAETSRGLVRRATFK